MKNIKTLDELNQKYDLELNRVISEIKKSKAKIVLLQFPDGLKPYAILIVDFLKERLKDNVEFLIWFGSCFGACDVPVGIEKLKPKIDLIIQFGHNEMMPDF
ncbi:hypothetical protein DRN69_04865 [Candidatus Pacearchaeota archaeon]|nr:MAG: hypothetical protein DRN69_04865 [Candidatus Pacearchaeota archaeon]